MAFRRIGDQLAGVVQGERDHAGQAELLFGSPLTGAWPPGFD
ncbi:hypothetical protein ACNAW0_10240 [Micromonospora sp. SL1-18]